MRLPDPVLNEDFYMVKRIGGDVTLPIPRTRFEELLYIYAGGTIERPTPKTVEERFLDYITDGESELPAPKTRLQSYMYNVANPSNKIPIVPPKTRFECYWFVMAEGNNVISDELPVEFTSVGGFLLVYTIWGNSEQDGTPSPENPVEVQSVGDLVIDEIDPNYGKYKIPVTVSEENGREITTVIYLDEPLRKIGDYADYIDFENRCVVRKISTLDLGSIEWEKTTTSNFQSRLLITNMRVISNNDINNALCSAYPEVPANKLTNFDVGFSSCLNTVPKLYFRDTDKMALTAQEFQASMTGIELYYTLAEPTVESLHIPQIPTFDGANIIDVDTTVKPSKIETVDGFLLDYTIWGNSEQDGTPSPENPVEVQSVGDLVIDEIDPNYGKYKIPVTVSGENGREITTVIYLDEPLRKIGDYADYIDFEKRRVVRKISTLDLGSIEWEKTTTSNFRSRLLITNMRVVGNNDINNALCSAYPEVPANKLTNFDVGFSSCLNTVPKLYFRDTDKMALTAQEFQASMTGIELYYTLAEPTVESLHIPQIPTFVGTNVLDVDTTVKPSKIELVTRTE